MDRRSFVAGAMWVGIGTTALAQPVTPPAPAAVWQVPSDAEIRRILVERIDTQKAGVGIVVGVIDGKSRRIVAYGQRAKGDPTALDGETVFEIGSITKVFTSLLLSDMTLKGEVALDDPVAKYLPPTVRLPQRGGKQITLKDLATHTSGLPGMPSNFSPNDPSNPYADYTVEQMYAFLGDYTLPRDIGAIYAYSNLGVGLLGHALARRAGTDYPSLVRQRITGPLGMTDTAVAFTPSMRARLAKPYDAALDPAANWDLPTLAGAGALRSDTNDMLTFLAAYLGIKPTPLKAAMDQQSTLVRRPAGGNMEVALGWHIRETPAGELIWHNGGTGGYRTFAGYNPATRIGVVVMTNAATQRGGDDIGFHLLGGTPLAPAPKAIVYPPTVSLTETQAEALVGRYQLAPGILVEVTRNGSRIFAQLTNQGRNEIFAESPTRIFWRAVDAQGTFEIGPDGKASKFTLHQFGRSLPAPRVGP